jgi:UDP-N-acetyl-2-amino-2-deoxyglucuronate dehydrogenase
MNKRFVLIGVGFVAPRHMKAIKDVGGELVAIMDPHDSVGIIDSYFPEAKYFSEFERFDRYCTKRGDIDYTVVCSPNYLHSSHTMFGLRIGSDVICEKPLVLRERNLDELLKIEEQTGKRVWNILQLRLSDVYTRIKDHIECEVVEGRLFHRVALEYCAPRGSWYDYSWKMDKEKSGGLISNIGIHLLDLLSSLFNGPVRCLVPYNGRVVYERDKHFTLQFKDALVDVRLSIDGKEKRVITINDTEFDLTPKMKDLHTKSYQEILAGNGFGISDARPAIRLCDQLRGEI